MKAKEIDYARLSWEKIGEMLVETENHFPDDDCAFCLKANFDCSDCILNINNEHLGCIGRDYNLRSRLTHEQKLQLAKTVLDKGIARKSISTVRKIIIECYEEITGGK